MKYLSGIEVVGGYCRKGHKAGLTEDMRVIDSHEKLRWLIELQQPKGC